MLYKNRFLNTFIDIFATIKNHISFCAVLGRFFYAVGISDFQVLIKIEIVTDESSK